MSASGRSSPPADLRAMLTHLKRDPVNLSLPAAHLLVLALIAGGETGPWSFAGLGLLTGLSLFGWLRSLRHARLISDIPTARVASAPQGYVELQGRGKPLDGTPLRSPVNGLPLLWYRVVTEEKGSDGKWKRVGTVESDHSFQLRDASGACAVDPEGAEMLIRRRDVFLQGDRRQTQWAIITDDPLYVLGEFATVGSVDHAGDSRAETSALLAAWKADPDALRARFDLDGDGEIDLREWALARAQARREVHRRQAELQAAPDLHVVRRPAKRLYLISDLPPDTIARRYRLGALAYAALFLAWLGTIAWLSGNLR